VTRPAEGALRRELLRIDRLDGALRARWVGSRFTDRATERALDELGAVAMAWLRGVVEEHGWPGRALVGAKAADAAVRLIQHVEHDDAFRWHCLELVREAAERGDLPLHHVAYLTDALRIGAGQHQLYGTKFHRDGDALVPLPIERARGVDRRRAALGLPPLAAYARQVRRRFA
jgi:hypothetical protein